MNLDEWEKKQGPLKNIQMAKPTVNLSLSRLMSHLSLSISLAKSRKRQPTVPPVTAATEIVDLSHLGELVAIFPPDMTITGWVRVRLQAHEGRPA